MKIKYDVGPDVVRMGKEEFRRGVPKTVPDDLAKIILDKTVIKFEEAKKLKAESSKEEEA